MNRDGDSDEPTTDEEDVESPETPRQGDNVIAFPGARVKPAAEGGESGAAAGDEGAPAQGTDAAETTDAPAASAESPSPQSDDGKADEVPLGEAAGDEAPGAGSDAESGMTLDAFERAVRSAVRDKLGEGADSRTQGADELVAQVFSALTGKDAKTALSEVRQRLSEPLRDDEAAVEGDVIDLGAVREARQKANTESAQRIGGALKDTFNQFLANLSERQGYSGEITLDAAFFRQHGASLLGNLFQGLASALMQQSKPASPPSPPGPTGPPGAEAKPPEAKTGDESDNGEAGASAAGAEPKTDAGQAGGETGAGQEPAKPRGVQVKLDLGSILAGLFRRRQTPPQDPQDPKDE